MVGADALFVLTDWKQFKNLDLDRAKSLLKEPVIFDGRDWLDRDAVQAKGFTYFAVGKRTNGLDHIDEKSGDYAFALLKNGGNK